MSPGWGGLRDPLASSSFSWAGQEKVSSADQRSELDQRPLHYLIPHASQLLDSSLRGRGAGKTLRQCNGPGTAQLAVGFDPDQNASRQPEWRHSGNCLSAPLISRAEQCLPSRWGSSPKPKKNKQAN
ncbi:hypothetical protein AOLI_G00099370 [Acnodon oligacanthus]